MVRTIHSIAGIAVAMLLCASVLAADKPAGKPPADDDVDYLLKHAAPAPATRPAIRPTTSPFKPAKDDGRRAATMTLSNGEKIKGRFSTTLARPFRVFDAEKKEYRDVPFALIKSIQAKVIWERDEKEWHFRESGSDIKEYSGKTYPARETQYIFTLTNGQTLSGAVAGPLYLQTDGDDKIFILHKRDKGEVGQTLKQLVYIVRVEFAGE
jgi:hypothetical protein